MPEQGLALADAPAGHLSLLPPTPTPVSPAGTGLEGLEVPTVCFQIATTQGDLGAGENGAKQVLPTVSPRNPPGQPGAEAGRGGHLGVPVGGHHVSAWSDPLPLPGVKGDSFHLSFLPLPTPPPRRSSFHTSLYQFLVMRGFQVTVLIFSPSP